MTQQDTGRQRDQDICGYTCSSEKTGKIGKVVFVCGPQTASVLKEAIRIALEREYIHTEAVVVEETPESLTFELVSHNNLIDALKGDIYQFKESRFTYDKLVSALRHKPKRIPRNQYIPRRPFLRFTTRVKCTGKQQRKQKQRPKTPKQKRR